MKPKIYSVIPMFLLSISLLSADQVYAVDNNINKNLIIAQNPNKKANISQALKDLKNAIKSFNDDIREVIARTKNRNEVNSKNILKKLDNLSKELASLPENTQTSKIVNNINSTISKIDKIIKPLENGLTNDKVTQVQKDLNFFTRRNISEQSYGTVGPKTQEEIEIFTNSKIKELDTQIVSLESLLNKEEVKPTPGISPQPPSKAKNDGLELTNEVKEYEVELNTIKSNLSYLTITAIISGFILLGLIGLMIFCIYRIITLIEQQRQITNYLKNNQKFIDIDEFQIELNEIYNWVNNSDARLKQIESSSHNKTSSTSPDISTSQPHTEPVSQPQPRINQSHQPANISNTNIGLVSAYNINSHSLSQQAIAVSETEYTSEQRRLGKNIQYILEFDSRGNYWIITEGNDEYLVPKAKMRINEHNYLTISTFFNCLGYNSNSSNNFTLVKPAKVYRKGEQWELIEIGELQF
jgi:hypothetical protein